MKTQGTNHQNNLGYASAADDYLANGWQPLPLLDAGKGTVPPGFTGYNAKAVTADDVNLWSARYPTSGVALHLTEQIGLDVDNYPNPARGLSQGDAAEAFRELEADLGPLPRTVVVSSRLMDADYDGHSGIPLFRLPTTHSHLIQERVWKSEAGPGIDVIRFGHRQVVVWPSRHVTRGNRYVALDQRSGEIIEGPLPPADALPILPKAWADYLLKRTSTKGEPAPEFADFWTPGSPCSKVQQVLARALERLPAARHDTTRNCVLRLSRLGEQGHQGTAKAVEDLRREFVRSRAASGGDGQWRADDEWDRMLPGIVGILEREGLTDPGDKRCCEPPSGAPWPPIIELTEGSPEPFPVDALPEGMRTAVYEVARTRMVDAAIPAAAFLGVAAGALGTRVHVRINSSWHTRCNLYVVAIGETGDGKSPGMSPALEPLVRMEEALQEEAAIRRRSAKVEIPSLKAELKEESSKAQPDPHRLLELQRRIDDHEAALRAQPRIMVDDVTPERLAEVLAENDGHIVAVNDEGALFAHLLGMYSPNPNLGPFLKSWDGTRLTMDRKGTSGRDRTAIIVKSPRMTLLAAVQPSVMRELGNERHKSLRQRGVLGRLLVVWPQPMAGKRTLRDQPHRAHLQGVDAWNRHVEDLSESLGECYLTFSAGAYSRFVEWHDELEAGLPAGHVYADIKDFVVKIREQVARIAGLIAVLDDRLDDLGEGEVQEEHVAQAIRLGEHFVRTATAVVESWQGQPVALAEQLLAKIKQERKETFSVRDAYRLTKSNKEQILVALELLQLHGYVRPADPDLGFGRLNDRNIGQVSPIVMANPALWQ